MNFPTKKKQNLSSSTTTHPALRIALHCRDDSGRTPLWYACYLNRMSTIIYLCSRGGCDVNEACDLGNTPLHVAAMQGHLKARASCRLLQLQFVLLTAAWRFYLQVE